MPPKLRDALLKPSTRLFVREAVRARDFSFTDFMHGYIYTRWAYLYIGIGTGEHWIARSLKPVVNKISGWKNSKISRKENDEGVDVISSNGNPKSGTFADGYHGKVVPLESARKLVTVQEPIELPDLEQVIPFESARDIVLRNPDHIAVLECPCRASRENPCTPLDVCLIIGEPFTGMVMEQHPHRARRISQAEAEQILIEETERGHVHHAFFKDAMLGRFYAICNCCSCCCGAMQAHRNGTPMLISSGYVSYVNPDFCTGCGDCAQDCQFGAISVAGPHAVVNREVCMGCGVCVELCTNSASALFRDSTKGEPLEICELMAQVGI